MKKLAILIVLLGLTLPAFAKTNVTIGTVNNSDMIIMRRLSKEFMRQHPEIRLNWVILKENILRQRITADISTGRGQFDIITIGAYETRIWAEKGWLNPFETFPENYDAGDFVQTVYQSLSYDGKLYAIPFYSESAMTFYRKDLFEKKGLQMPEQPTYGDIYQFASRLHDPENNLYGICLRGKAGWGENIAFVSILIHAFGARWFDMNWKPQLNSPQWKQAISFYIDLLQNYGPPGAIHNGHNENRALFANGQCAMWIDATVVAGFLSNPKKSIVSQTVGFAKAPNTPSADSNWLWSWALAIPAHSKAIEAAQKFIFWATSKEYVQLVGRKEGWKLAPPGTRRSTYANPDYQKAAGHFSDLVLEAIEATDSVDSQAAWMPYRGLQFVNIPEFQTIGSQVGHVLTEALAGRISIEAALEQAQHSTEQIMQKAGHESAQ